MLKECSAKRPVSIARSRAATPDYSSLKITADDLRASDLRFDGVWRHLIVAGSCDRVIAAVKGTLSVRLREDS